MAKVAAIDGDRIETESEKFFPARATGARPMIMDMPAMTLTEAS
jgi:hypothetical protein